VPFSRPAGLELAYDANAQLAAEDWLRERMNIDPGVDVRALSAQMAEDGRLVRGQKLWQLGRREEAKRELEELRREYAEDPLASYQLSLFYRELGLYRSSILAVTSVLRDADVDVFGAPKFLGRLAYPIYYSDLVTAESLKYQLDPLLLFALIRQESLFESFATSSAVAQGLSQVIPDTGQYIAQILNWPDYDNEDLYKPHVGIAFGAFYLAQQLEAFDGEVAVALSAYNGGPGNAARWQSQVTGDIDRYIETVDFYETRQYIERIYTGQRVYRYLYGE
jgi:soluble lytic murein transglycosylase